MFSGALRGVEILLKLDIYTRVGYKYNRCAGGQPPADIEKNREDTDKPSEDRLKNINVYSKLCRCGKAFFVMYPCMKNGGAKL